MKINLKIKGSLLFLIVLVSGYIFVGCSRASSGDYLRIHIRAHSNSEVDQAMKLEVRDEVINFLTPYICASKNKQEAVESVLFATNELEEHINDFLASNDYTYTAKIKINNEFFPTRVYESVTLYANYYDAIIVELGSAEGDNWWCVVYPPLCFMEGKIESVSYKSKIEEIINRYFK